MSRKASYEDCLNFIENHLDIKLLDFQKKILKCIFENKEVRTGRGCGRKMIADALGKYIAHLYGENDYGVKPDVVIPYPNIRNNGYRAKVTYVDEHFKKKSKKKNPYYKYSYNTALINEKGESVWGIDNKWLLWEIKNGNGLPPIK